MDGIHNSLIDDLKHEFRGGSMVNRLIIANLSVFLVLLIIKIFAIGLFPESGFFAELVLFLGVPSGFIDLAKKPWTLFTYMFVHLDFFHILWNMLILYWFGKIFIHFAGNERVLPVYVMGGLAGAVFALLAGNLFPGFATEGGFMIGASAGVTAILIAAATIRPNYTIHLFFLGEVRIKWVALFFFVTFLVGIGNLDNTGGHLAHIGGAAIGLLFGLQLNNGTDISEGFANFFDWIGEKLSPKPEPKPKPTIAFKNTVPPTPKRKKRVVVRKNDAIRQAKVDAILDKIKEVGGYDNLSPEEKEYLFRASKED